MGYTDPLTVLFGKVTRRSTTPRTPRELNGGLWMVDGGCSNHSLPLPCLVGALAEDTVVQF